jgi:hypothetical protein
VIVWCVLCDDDDDDDDVVVVTGSISVALLTSSGDDICSCDRAAPTSGGDVNLDIPVRAETKVTPLDVEASSMPFDIVVYFPRSVTRPFGCCAECLMQLCSQFPSSRPFWRILEHG